jgi:hypothetical protein
MPTSTLVTFRPKTKDDLVMNETRWKCFTKYARLTNKILMRTALFSDIMRHRVVVVVPNR